MYTTFECCRQKYGVNTSENNGFVSISKITPYDFTKYHSALKDHGDSKEWTVFRDGKYIGDIYIPSLINSKEDELDYVAELLLMLDDYEKLFPCIDRT